MPPPPPSTCDVLVIGGGNAGFSAAISAREHGARDVVLVDKCPEEWAGGNSYFTAGAFRTVHAGLADLLPIVNNVDADRAGKIDMEPYSREDFAQDLKRVTVGRCDPRLGRILVDESNEAVKWLAGHGVRYQLSFNRQAYLVDGRYKFWGGMALKTQDGGKGLIEDHRRAAERMGIRVFFSASMTRLAISSTGACTGASVTGSSGRSHLITSRATILAAGGFEANPRMRAQHLGPGWDLAFVRGTPYNTGDVLEAAMRDAGAAQAGNWSGCHSVAWDANALPDSGDRKISNEFTKSGYPIGLMLNSEGRRFVDEGVDFRNFTYAKFGRAILQQPNGVAWQVYDSNVISWLRDEEYRDEIVQKTTADSVEELAKKCVGQGLSEPSRFVATIQEYNEAVFTFRKEHPGVKWDPAIKDGLSTESSGGGLLVPKTNWALPLDKGPFIAIKVSCGITFTFGGLKVDPETAGLISGTTGRAVPGLFCVGEMLGGIFYGNYPGGSGLTSGAVFGRRAGRAAAQVVGRDVVGVSARL